MSIEISARESLLCHKGVSRRWREDASARMETYLRREEMGTCHPGQRVEGTGKRYNDWKERRENRRSELCLAHTTTVFS